MFGRILNKLKIFYLLNPYSKNKIVFVFVFVFFLLFLTLTYALNDFKDIV